MSTIARLLALSLCLVCVCVAYGKEGDEAPPNALAQYLARPEPDFAWKLAESTEGFLGTTHRVELTSQKWQDIVWKHGLYVLEPRKIDHPNHMLLFVTGGKIGGQPKDSELQLYLALAAMCRARIAILYQVPNQPLMGNRVEDDLITETWLKYLETGDETWPLLFPMVKSAVKAMDALEALSMEKWQQPIKGFVITGASKRGWTSWLTAAGDKRIIATAPIVINTLNFPKQMPYQLETWGKYSEQIDDYTRKGLVHANGEPRSEREQKLWLMMDPYVYRKEITVPKLMIVGTNDRYWVVDALNLYWDDLVGPKYSLQVPNAGHNLDGGREAALRTLAVFFRHAALGQPLPAAQWKYVPGEKSLDITASSTPAPKSVKLWSALSETKDFRQARWSAVPVEGTTEFKGSVARPESGHAALYLELEYDFGGLKYGLTTQLYRE